MVLTLVPVPNKEVDHEWKNESNLTMHESKRKTMTKFDRIDRRSYLYIAISFSRGWVNNKLDMTARSSTTTITTTTTTTTTEKETEGTNYFCE